MKYINKSRLCLILLLLILIFTYITSYAQKTANDIKNSVVRLHIIANSDSDADQSLKLKVRDRLTRDAAYILEGSENSADALAAAKKNIDIIRQIAADEVKAQGYSQSVRVEIGTFPFPTKAYDDILLPAGSYNAVRVILGDGKGKNWWCVMYPPLCFTSGSITVSESAHKTLRDNLTESEYRLITESNCENIPVNIRFKIVELLSGIF